MEYKTIRHNTKEAIAILSLTDPWLLMLEVVVNRVYVAPCRLQEQGIIIFLNRTRMSYESVAIFVTRVTLLFSCVVNHCNLSSLPILYYILFINCSTASK